MKRLLLIAAAAALFAAPASANVVYTFSNTTFNDGGTLTGTITVSDDLTQVVDLSITSTPGSVEIGGHFFELVTYAYDPLLVYDDQLPYNTVRVSDAGGDQLQVTFPVLTATGATLYANNGSEHQPKSGNRIIVGGSLVLATTPTPEPATWTLALAGLGLIGFGMKRSTRSPMA